MRKQTGVASGARRPLSAGSFIAPHLNAGYYAKKKQDQPDLVTHDRRLPANAFTLITFLTMVPIHFNASRHFTCIGAMVKYDVAHQAYPRYAKLLKQLATQAGTQTICDVGGGARPSLTCDFVETHDLEYHVLDISAEELVNVPDAFETVHADICAADLALPEKYDVVTSKFVVEHVPNGYLFHKNIWSILSEDGYALHLFPTLYSPPFFVNYLTPDTLSTALLDFFAPQARARRKKFPTYYSWCRGPLQKQVRALKDLGYEVVEYAGFFGTPYLNRLKPLQKLDSYLAAKMVDHPLPFLTSYACLLLHKPPH